MRASKTGTWATKARHVTYDCEALMTTLREFLSMTVVILGTIMSVVSMVVVTAGVLYVIYYGTMYYAYVVQTGQESIAAFAVWLFFVLMLYITKPFSP